MKSAIWPSMILLPLGLVTNAPAQPDLRSALNESMSVQQTASRAENLRRKYHETERSARQLVAQLQRTQKEGANGDTGTAAIDRLKRQLRKAVEECFTIRQQIHEAELAQLEQKLNQARLTIKHRNQIKDEIISRHMSELLRIDSPGDSAETPPGSGVTQPPSSSLAESVQAEVAKRERMWNQLNGTWVLDRTARDSRPRTLTIDKNTWNFTDADGVQTGTVNLDSSGTGRIVVAFQGTPGIRSTWMGDYEVTDDTLVVWFKSANNFGGLGGDVEESLWNWSGIYHHPDEPTND